MCALLAAMEALQRQTGNGLETYLPCSRLVVTVGLAGVTFLGGKSGGEVPYSIGHWLPLLLLLLLLPLG